MIICFGTSLKVLKQYACLWPKRTDFAIVSIQWTPKDKQSKIKINGYCDDVMSLIIRNLQDHYPDLRVEDYSLKKDPIFKIAVDLKSHELDTHSKPLLLNHLQIKTKQSLKSDEKEYQENASLSNGIKEEEVKAQSVNSWFNKSFKPRKKPVVNNKKK